MFNPSPEQVRRFFIDTWAKHRASAPLIGLEPLALDVMKAHPEYWSLLEQAAGAPRTRGAEEAPQVPEHNLYLHLSLHLAIEEQLSIDQPRGLGREFERLAAAKGERHAALHEILECLGETMWRAQRDGTPPDAQGYLECVRRRG
ncbi:MAG: DUF1841 family protein [Burkholderiales bacterium]|nr:DUF1841 family protein [Burkholderiales bacterium]